ncbi:hypothetical protein [Streptomyces sp. NPDC007991]|uniref:hypothetical protein n=1 Tax=Streptomyces sp. NPDC007991 TaxID=3364803 RepID=UPI0036E6DC49
MSLETNRRAVLSSKKELTAALPAHGPSTVGNPDIASVGLPNGAVTEPGYLTFPAHPKGKDPS